MALMTDLQIKREEQARRRRFWWALSFALSGAIIAVATFILGHAGHAQKPESGIVAGVGAGMALIGGFLTWKNRPWDKQWRSEPIQTRRDRLQAERTRILWSFPLVGLSLLYVAWEALNELHGNDPRAIDCIRAGLPILYAWLVVLVVLGWDKQSLVNRRLLDDELTQAFRARALKAAFLVLMSGTTIALPLTLWRPETGVMAIIVALTAAGAVAGFRFAWLDRQANAADAGDD